MVLLSAVLAGLAAAAPARGAEDLDQLDEQAFRAAVDRVAPSVVRIETVGGLERVGGVLFGAGATTGTILTPDGYVVSSAFNFLHQPASILVQLPGGARKPARLVATDHNRMLALLKIDPEKPLPVPEIAPQGEIEVGQWAIGIGRAFEGDVPTRSIGIVSATHRVWGKAVQTDAAVSPNNYGGPLVDVRGRVIGVLVPLSPEETTELAGVEWYDSGIGFAIPAQVVQQLLPRLKQGKDLYPGVAGIHLPTKALAVAEPVLSAVRPRSPAQKAGLKGGDRVVEIDGRKIARAAELIEELRRRYAGDTIEIAALRDSKRIECKLELVAKLEPYEQAFLGILPLRPAGDQPEAKLPGIPVRYVYPESPAAKAGVQPGDVVVSFGGEPIQDPRALRARLAEKQPGDAAEFEVRHGKQARKIQVAMAGVPESLPPGQLPPAHAAVKPGEAKRPEAGTIALRNPAAAVETWAYVPEGYRADVPHGVVLWLHGSEGLNEKELVARWKPLCDRHDLILVAPKGTSAGRWRSGELRLIPSILAPVASAYTIDAARVVVAGREGGGAAAYLAAFRHGTVFRAAAAIEAPLAGAVPERDSLSGLAFYVARASASPLAGPIQQTITRLRAARLSVTVKELGPQPRDLTPDELAELARWIDTLDRI